MYCKFDHMRRRPHTPHHGVNGCEFFWGLIKRKLRHVPDTVGNNATSTQPKVNALQPGQMQSKLNLIFIFPVAHGTVSSKL